LAVGGKEKRKKKRTWATTPGEKERERENKKGESLPITEKGGKKNQTIRPEHKISKEVRRQEKKKKKKTARKPQGKRNLLNLSATKPRILKRVKKLRRS